MAFDKSKLFSLFENIQKEHRDQAGNVVVKQRTKNSDVLIVDGTNTFIRTWTVVPTLNDNGEHVGGASGFLSSLGYAIKLLSPTRVIIVFDGKGGSARRRSVYPEYKAGRKPLKRLNRAYEDMVDPGDEEKQMYNQMGILADFLTTLPVTLVSIDNIEADDVIAYIATSIFTKPEEKVTIMSADKDFYQLVCDRVNIWSPIKKKVYGVQDIINEFEGLHPHNYVYFRIFDGDNSDNIGGIRGFGLKTTVKSLPMLKESARTSVEDIVKYASERANESAAFEKIVNGVDILNRNYSLMQLHTPDFSSSLKIQIVNAMNNGFTYNKFQFLQKLTQYGMHHAIPNYHVWLQEVFHPISIF